MWDALDWLGAVTILLCVYGTAWTLYDEFFRPQLPLED